MTGTIAHRIAVRPAATAVRPLRHAYVPRARYVRRRLAVGLVGLVVVAGTLAVADAAADGSGANVPSAVPPSAYIVQPGDTLWSIAEVRDPQSTAAYVDQLVAMNGTTMLQVGQQILVP
jgi:LysM repeat protein